MADQSPESEPGLRERLSQRGEEAIGELAQGLLENPVFNQALQVAFGAREKAVEAQQAAMGALNLPSAADIERLTRRVRSVSQRLEALEDGIDRVEERIGTAAGGGDDEGGDDSLAAIEQRLDELARDLRGLRKRLGEEVEVSATQESLGVSDA